MAEHKLAILVTAIGAAKAAKDLKGVDLAVSNIGSRAGQGLRTAGANIARIGVVAGAGIALAVKTGLDDLASLESAVTSVDGAIKQMGLTGQVSGAQVAGWANEIESAVGAAFDDKAITAATTTLIRFGKVTPKNLRPAMAVMTDLAAKTGDVDSAASLLSKALADPTKAAGKLARQGIILTKQQQDQIKAFVKANKTADAQRVILDAVAESTKGAALASQGPYQRALSTLADVSEDARKALAEGFLPVIEKVASLLSTELAKPQTMANIREFGQGLAKGLDSLVEIARNLPWESIGTSLKIAGAGGKAVLEAFTNLPPWVQTAVLTGWGLNKLTGGALGDIVGELGKGLIKGVLGMNAAVVNINAGTVNGGGGVPGAGGGGSGLLGGVAAGAAAVGVGAVMKEGFKQVSESLFPPSLAKSMQEALRIVNPLVGVADTIENIPTALGAIADAIKGKPTNKPSTYQNAFGAGPVNQGGQMKGWAEAQKAWVDNGAKITDLHHGAVTAIDGNKQATKDAGSKVQNEVRLGSQGTANATLRGTSGTTAAVNSSASRIVNGFAANRPIVTTSVKVYVTPAAVTSSTSTSERYGNTTGSGGSGSNGTNKPT